MAAKASSKALAATITKANLWSMPALPFLRTLRLSLAPASPDDLDRLHGLLTEPEIRRYLCDDAVLGREQVSDMLEGFLSLAPQGLGLWMLSRREGDWIGCLGLQPVSGPAAAAWPSFAGEVEPLVALRAGAWGEGFATEGLSRAAAYAFQDLRLPRLVAFVDQPNAASHRLMARTGFAEVGGGPGPKYELSAYALERNEGRHDDPRATP